MPGIKQGVLNNKLGDINNTFKGWLLGTKSSLS